HTHTHTLTHTHTHTHTHTLHTNTHTHAPTLISAEFHPHSVRFPHVCLTRDFSTTSGLDGHLRQRPTVTASQENNSRSSITVLSRVVMEYPEVKAHICVCVCVWA